MSDPLLRTISKEEHQNMPSVTGVTAEQSVSMQPKEEEREEEKSKNSPSSMGYYGGLVAPVTPVTSADECLVTNPVTPDLSVLQKPREDCVLIPATVGQEGLTTFHEPPVPWPVTLPRLILDLETYYDSGYSLDKLSIPEYVLRPEFHVHGVAVSYPDGRTDFRTDVAALLQELQSAYGQNLEQVLVVFHNSAFDYFALFHRFGLRIAHILDTMLLARLIHGSDDSGELRDLATRYDLPPKGDLSFMKGVRVLNPDQLSALRQYAITDADITARLAGILLPKATGRPIELWTAEHSVKMFVERPFSINLATVQATAAALESSLAQRVHLTGYTEKNIRSTKLFPEILTTALAATGRSLPVKSGRTGMILALAKGDRAREELILDDDLVVRHLVEAKVALGSAANLRGRLNHLEQATKLMNGYCPFLLSYHRANTGRFAGGDGFNIQNLKKVVGSALDAELATGVRGAISAPPGYMLVSGDASQIEARILAYVAGQSDLHQAFADGNDVYSTFASAQFRCEVRKPRAGDGDGLKARLTAYRQVGKTAVLGLGYGMGARTFFQRLKAQSILQPLFHTGALSQDVVASVVHQYRQQYPTIPKFWHECETAAQRAIMGMPASVRGIGFAVNAGTLYITLPSGRLLVYPHAGLIPPSGETRSYLDEFGVEQYFTSDGLSIEYASGFPLYGGLLVENIVQAIARDCLVWVIYRLETAGCPVVLHCHDSVTATVPEGLETRCAETITTAWKKVPAWINGLVLDAETSSGTTLLDV